MDLDALRAEFPILHQEINGRPLVYLDNAASAQRPACVIDAVADYYRQDHANVHRGVHTLSDRATRAFETARETVARFINAASTREVIWTRGTTEAINLVAQSFARPRLAAGDEILISTMEHHANIVPWQMVADQTGARLKVAPIHRSGELDMEAFERLLGERTRLVAISHVSNSLGTINPAARIVSLARERGIPVLFDGAQAGPHLAIDVQALGCDFYAFSGHKLFGPTGIGVLWGREALLEAMPPWHGGGEMIRTVSFEKSTWNELPFKFEAGTPHIAGAVGLGRALEWFMAQDREALAAHEDALLARCTEVIEALPGLRIIGTAADKVSVVSFVADDVHAHDLGTILDHQGVAIRTGHHCTMPLLDWYGVPATARASMAFYNTQEEVEVLGQALERALAMFRD
ncbi:MAG: cysteine desulfurase [Gammaproteobacteria bacterium]|nr:cysteine desulfurase [Gammaproteobacteria bacterium]